MTDLSLIENFLFIPAGSQNTGTLYELSPIAVYQPNAFVLVPYHGPEVPVANPLFFSVDAVYQVGDLAPLPGGSQPRLVGNTTLHDYLEKVKRLKYHIQQGDIYEVNYCIRFAANTTIDPVSVFKTLCELSAAPYACLLRMGHKFVLSASPELFLHKRGERLYTKPIKGTAPRGATPGEDEALKNALYHSEKERTENVMAVDVARNDLSQLAKKGTVQVNRLYNIESFETVHQMVSTVSCELRDNPAFDRILEATFPMASMTGAPKLRARQFIAETEDFTRGFYSGAMGLIDANGDFNLSVNIRCIFYDAHKKEVSIAVGGAITYLSEPEQEYEECLLKAKALVSALGATIE